MSKIEVVATKDLTNGRLDRVVLFALGFSHYSGPWYVHDDSDENPNTYGHNSINIMEFHPSVDPVIAQSIIEKNAISISPNHAWGQNRPGDPSNWLAGIEVSVRGYYSGHGETPLIAAMKALIEFKLGPKVGFRGDRCYFGHQIQGE